MSKQKKNNLKTLVPTTDKQPIILDVTDERKQKYKFSMKKYWVTKEGIKKFVPLGPPFGHKRKTRPSQVNEIKQLLQNGEHFESSLTLENVGNGNYRVLDGHHRISSVGKFLDTAPKGSKVAFFAGEYDFNGMSDAEKKDTRRKIFRKYNVGIRQSTNDFIESYQDDIPMFQEITGNNPNIPCSVYGDTVAGIGDTLKFKDTVGGLFASEYKRGIKDGFQGGYSGNAQQFVDECIERPLTQKDVKDIEYVWFIICKSYGLKPLYNFKKVRGARTIESCISKTTPFYAVMRLIMDNKHKFSETEIITRLQRDTVKETIIRQAEFGGRSSCKNCHKLLHYYVNTGYENNPVKQFLPILTKEEFKSIEEEIEGGKSIGSGVGVEIEDIDSEEEVKGEKDKSKWTKFKGKYK